MKQYLFLCGLILLITSCKKEKEVKFTQAPAKKEQQKATKNYLPFTDIALNDLSNFKPSGDNWSIVGNVIADRNKEKTFISEAGTGILLNKNDQDKGKNKHIFTAFEHGDIELELDVMMPVKSNSGIYLQGRYEVQLYDSWNIKKPKYSDMGGIYQRWNTNAEKGKRGYEGHSPRVNVAKAPGLWQHFKIIFHAPKFDGTGKKIKNAWFEKVWLNGVLIHQNVELNGTTRGAAFKDETLLGPLMIQGNHGPVAFKNIKYKLYDSNKLSVSNLTRTEYKSFKKIPANLDTIPKEKEEKTKYFSFEDVVNSRDKKMVVFSGILSVPEKGNYLFDGRSNGISELYINNKKILNIRGGIDKATIKTLSLEQGDIPFKLIYSQFSGKRGLSLHVEGPHMQKYALLEGAKNDTGDFDPLKGIIVSAETKPVMQRSFVNHNGKKHTHCISVGTPKGIHYSYNLATGSLLKVWSGSFLNTTHMWLSRGKHQLGEPVGFAVSMHGDLEFAPLENTNTPWPEPLPENKGFKQLGYELDASRMPSFSYQVGKTTITNSFSVPEDTRQLNKSIKISKGKNLWHKIAEGERIKALSDNIYIVNNESYYIDFYGNNLKPIIRHINGKDELLVEIPQGDSTINYSIIW